MGVTLPIRWDLTGPDAITQGTAWRRARALDYIDPATGQVVTWDTTGYTARMQVRPSHDGPVVLELTTANGRLQTGVINTTIVLALGAAATVNVADWGLGVYDLELIPPNKDPIRVYYGYATLNREVTR